MPPHRFLHRVAQFRGVIEVGRFASPLRSSFPYVLAVNVNQPAMLVEGFPQLDKGIAVVVCAIEGCAIWRTSFKHEHGNRREACTRRGSTIPSARRGNASIQALTDLVDHCGLARPTGTIAEHVGEASMFADRTHDGTVSLFKQAMGDGGLLEPGFFLFRRKPKRLCVLH